MKRDYIIDIGTIVGALLLAVMGFLLILTQIADYIDWLKKINVLLEAFNLSPVDISLIIVMVITGVLLIVLSLVIIILLFIQK